MAVTRKKRAGHPDPPTAASACPKRRSTTPTSAWPTRRTWTSPVTRRMGLYVVARLAKRHNIKVRLRDNEDIEGGLIARINVPAELVAPAGRRVQSSVDDAVRTVPARRRPGRAPPSLLTLRSATAEPRQRHRRCVHRRHAAAASGRQLAGELARGTVRPSEVAGYPPFAPTATSPRRRGRRPTAALTAAGRTARHDDRRRRTARRNGPARRARAPRAVRRPAAPSRAGRPSTTRRHAARRREPPHGGDSTWTRRPSGCRSTRPCCRSGSRRADTGRRSQRDAADNGTATTQRRHRPTEPARKPHAATEPAEAPEPTAVDLAGRRRLAGRSGVAGRDTEEDR